MIQIGKINTLEVIKNVEFGVYLEGDEYGEILLPNKYVPKNTEDGDELDVFIYFDSEDRIIATTEKPYAMVGEFAFLKVVSLSSFGAFLDWGLMKDLLVPFREQKQKMIKGKSYIVYIYLDKKSDRIAASSKIHKYYSKYAHNFQLDDEVELLICEKTDIGYNCIINGTHPGLLYTTEVFQTLKPGQQTKGFIKKLRDDNKIDLCLQKSGYEKIDEISQKVLDTLIKEGGTVSVGDKSSPEIIYEMFGVSKKSYKKAIGALFKNRKITIEEKGIRLINKSTGKKP